MCSKVNFEIIRQGGHAAALRKELVDHINGCESCLEALRLLSESFSLPPAAHSPNNTCPACLSSLAAYIELEQRDPLGAARTFPSVWWHLWSCPACAETYHLTYDLLAASREGAIPPLPGTI